MASGFSEAKQEGEDEEGRGGSSDSFDNTEDCRIVMALKRISPGSRSTLERSKFCLRAEVVVNNDRSLLVKRENIPTTFWIDKGNETCDLEVGEKRDFVFEIHTFVSNKQDESGVIKTLLRLVEVLPAKAKIKAGEEFRGGCLYVKILEVKKTELNNLYLIKMTVPETGEIIYARHWNTKTCPSVTEVGTEVVEVRLMKCKNTIANDGTIYERTESREIDGEQKEYQVYFPWLEVDLISLNDIL